MRIQPDQLQVPLYQIDAFTSHLFRGNPAAVCPLEQWISDELMQAIATENNISETAFFVQRDDGDFDLRWFTPTFEVDLCGHATLASAYVLFNYYQTNSTQINFHTRSGQLSVTRINDLMAMDFPVLPLTPSEVPIELAHCGLNILACYRNSDFCVIVETEQELMNYQADFLALGAIDTRGICFTAAANHADLDFVSRFFAPRAGINEDPVTGSAHCYLTPYWAEQLGKQHLHARQISKRGGDIECELVQDRVMLKGYATCYLAGMINLPAK